MFQHGMDCCSSSSIETLKWSSDQLIAHDEFCGKRVLRQVNVMMKDDSRAQHVSDEG